MTSIVLLNLYGQKNIGDEAIQASAFSLLNQIFTSQKQVVKITTLCEDPENFPKYNFKSLEISNLQMPYGHVLQKVGNTNSHILKIIYFLQIMVVSIFLAFLGLIAPRALPRRGVFSFVKVILESSKVIGIGGGYLISKSIVKDFFGLGLTLLPIFVAKLYRKDILHLPISFGPFASSLQGYITFLALRNTEVFCREKISYDLLKRLDKNRTIKLYIFPDLALFLKAPKNHIKKKQKIWILTAREWLSKEKQKQYERALVALIDSLWIKYSLKTKFLVMVHNTLEDDDERVYLRIKSQILSKASLTVSYPTNHKRAQEELLKAQFAICTRMHSAILALTVNTPFLTIGYGHKGLGFMNSINLTKWYADIADVKKDNIIHLVESFIKSTSKSEIASKIEKQQDLLVKQQVKVINVLDLFLNK